MWDGKEGSLVDAWKKVLKQTEGAIEEAVVYEYKKRTESPIRSPIDKCNEDGLLICPLMWMRMVAKHGAMRVTVPGGGGPLQSGATTQWQRGTLLIKCSFCKHVGHH